MIPPQSEFSLTEVLVTLWRHYHSTLRTHDLQRSRTMTCRIQFVHARTRASHASLSHNPYPPKHSGDKLTQELSPVLALWRFSNFLDPVEKPVRGPPTFNPKSLGAFSGATIHDDTQVPGAFHESPSECRLRRPCRSPRRFGSRPSLCNGPFPTLPGEPPY